MRMRERKGSHRGQVGMGSRMQVKEAALGGGDSLLGVARGQAERKAAHRHPEGLH